MLENNSSLASLSFCQDYLSIHPDKKSKSVTFGPEFEFATGLDILKY